MEDLHAKQIKRELKAALTNAHIAKSEAFKASRQVEEVGKHISELQAQRTSLDLKLKATLQGATKVAHRALGFRRYAGEAEKRAQELQHAVNASSEAEEKRSKELRAVKESPQQWPIPDLVKPKKVGPGAADWDNLASPRFQRRGLSEEEKSIAFSGRGGWLYRQNDLHNHGGVLTPEVSMQNISMAPRHVMHRKAKDERSRVRKDGKEVAAEKESVAPSNRVTFGVPQATARKMQLDGGQGTRIDELRNLSRRIHEATKGLAPIDFHAVGPQIKAAKYDRKSKNAYHV